MRLALVALVLALSACTPVFFQPTGTIYSSPGIYGIDYQPVEFRAADGTALFAWFMPARGEAHGTVLYLHGNAQNISAHFVNVAWMPAAGFNVLAMDYRLATAITALVIIVYTFQGGYRALVGTDCVQATMAVVIWNGNSSA